MAPLALTRFGAQLKAGGKTVRLAGFNFYDAVFSDNISGGPGLTPMATVTAVLDAAVAMGHNAIRIHTAGIGYGKSGTFMPTNGAYNEAALVQLDKVMDACRTRNLWVMRPFTDRWNFYHGGAISFAEMMGVTGTDDQKRTAFFTDTATIRPAFFAYVTTLLNRTNTVNGQAYKADPTDAIYETGNEIWDVPAAWSSAFTAFLKNAAPAKLTADGSAASGELQYTKFHTSSGGETDANMDIVGAHFYDDHRMDIAELQQQAAWAAAAGKVFLVGEYDWRNTSQGTQYSSAVQNTSTTRSQWLTALEQYGNGDFMWAYTGPATSGHDDGYQLLVTAPQNTEQTSAKTALAAHARVLNPSAAAHRIQRLRGAAQPTPSTMPTGTEPGWVKRMAQDFDVDMPEGAFVFGSNSALLSSSAAYAAYGSSVNGYQDGHQDTSHVGEYRPSATMSVSNSRLIVRPRVINGVPVGAHYHPVEDGVSPTSGAWNRGPYRWLRFKGRALGTTNAFGWVALFIAPNWPNDGEFDFPEDGLAQTRIMGRHHFANPDGGGQDIGPATGLNRQVDHEYGIRWTPGRVEYIVDGTTVLDTTQQVGTQPMSIHFQGATTGTIPGATDTGEWSLDWVRIDDWVPPNVATYSSDVTAQFAAPLAGVLNAQVANISAHTSAGFKLVEIECGWDQAQPSQGAFSASYLAKMVGICQQYKAAGYRVVVSPGLHYPPAWVTSLTNGQYRDQNGVGSGTPNFTWNPAVRTAAGAYISQLVTAIGASVDYYRVGLSGSGECYYPNTSSHQWWAFDALAQGSAANLPAGVGACPMPGWTPGAATWNGAAVTVTQATAWWNWYEGALINAHNWQTAAYRSAGWAGLVMYNMPGVGAVPHVIDARLGQLLAPMTGNTGDNQMENGSAWHLQLAALNLTNAVVNVSSIHDGSGDPVNNSSTTADAAVALAAADPWNSHWSSARWISYLAGQRGARVLGENVGSNTAADVAGIMAQAQACGLYGLMWSYDAQMFDGSHATPTQIVSGFRTAYSIVATAQHRIQRLRGRVTASQVTSVQHRIQRLRGRATAVVTTPLTASLLAPAAVDPFEPFTLDASGSAGTTRWVFTQTAGPAVTLSGTGSQRTAIAPVAAEGVSLSFAVTVSATGQADKTASVTVAVQAPSEYLVRGDGTLTPIEQYLA